MFILCLDLQENITTNYTEFDGNIPIKDIMTAQRRTFVTRFEEAMKITNGQLVCLK